MRMPHTPLQSSYEREEVHALIAATSPRIQLVENEKARTENWRHFRRVYLDGLLQPYVRCIHCTGLIINRHGTSSLLRHNCQPIAQIRQLETKAAAAAAAAVSAGAAGLEDVVGIVEMEQRRQLEELAQYHCRVEEQVAGGQGRHSPAKLMIPKLEEDEQNGYSSTNVGFHATMEVGEKLADVACAPPSCKDSSSNASTLSPYQHCPITPSPTSIAPSTSTMMVTTQPYSYNQGIKSPASNHGNFEAIQHRVVESQVAFVVNDLVPVVSMEQPGFRQLAQVLIDLGATFGKIPLSHVLVSSASLLKFHIPNLCLRVQEGLIPIVLSHDLGISLDRWLAQGNTSRQFLTLTGHYVDHDFQMCSTLLGTRELKSTSLHCDSGTNTSVLITEAAVDILVQYTGNVEEAARKLRSSVLVTEESNLEGALTIHKCACSLLTAILDDVLVINRHTSRDFHNINKQNSQFPQYHHFISEALHTINLFHRHEQELQLKQPLTKNSASTWMNIYDVMSNLLDNLEEIQRLPLHANDQEPIDLNTIQRPPITHLNKLVLTSTINFLQLFQRCLECLSSDTSYPTINLCVLWKLKLENHCENHLRDKCLDNEDPLYEVCSAILKRLRSDFVFGKLHYVTLLLDPNFKSLKMLPDEVRMATMKYTADLLREDFEADSATDSKVKVKRETSSEMTSSSKEDVDGPPANKRSRILVNFTEFLDDKKDCGTGDRAESELQRYVAAVYEEDIDILNFWKTSGAEFPLLQRLARRILAVPACSAAIKYPLSTQGRQWAEKRARLQDNVNEILLLHGKI